jgi:hypothetical protein
MDVEISGIPPAGAGGLFKSSLHRRASRDFEYHRRERLCENGSSSRRDAVNLANLFVPEGRCEFSPGLQSRDGVVPIFIPQKAPIALAMISGCLKSGNL